MERQRVHDERSADRNLRLAQGIALNVFAPIISPGRMTDHRINLTLYRLDQILAGDLDEIVDALTADAQAAMLAELNG